MVESRLMDSLTISFQDFSVVTALLLVLTYIIIDGLYAYYTIQIAKRHAFRAATTSGVMHFLLAVGVLNYVHNFLYVIPLAIGSWIGTYIIVRWHKTETLIDKENLES